MTFRNIARYFDEISFGGGLSLESSQEQRTNFVEFRLHYFCTILYHPYKIALTDGQKKKLQKAHVSKTAVALRVKPEQIGRSDELLLTATQISRVKKTAAAGKGRELNLSQTQLFFIRYTEMEVYCVKEKQHTPSVKGSEKVVITKNNRKLCGITKTCFLPGN